jgi:hypothetical protein
MGHRAPVLSPFRRLNCYLFIYHTNYVNYIIYATTDARCSRGDWAGVRGAVPVRRHGRRRGNGNRYIRII